MRILRHSALLLLLLPTLAMAQIDPDPNGVGIYFDQAATRVATTTAAPSEFAPVEVDAWLVATRCSLIGEVDYWEGRVSTSGAYGMIVGGAAWGQNIADNMPGMPAWNFRVYVGESVPVTNPLILANLTIALYAGASGPTWLYVGGVQLTAGPTGATLHPASGAEALPVAVINGEMPVTAAPATWGAVKSLYGR